MTYHIRRWNDGADIIAYDGSDVVGALEKAVAAGKSLAYADLGWLPLQGANLENADLRKALLDGADLQNSNLKGAKLTLARLVNTRFTNAILPNEFIRDAQLDAQTLLRKMPCSAVTYLRKALSDGEVDGNQRAGAQAGFIGTLANGLTIACDEVYQQFQYHGGLENHPAEHFFTGIRLRDSGTQNPLVDHAIRWCDGVLGELCGTPGARMAI
jgi:hypothetical protein